ncbi:DUF2975 domain-containing protein [Emticicia sp. C21]|uniref:DUF2975 domain-containing protein n=1 Tax=Emticicia sp. C21 TaxID=2302915 RepID=UPI000E349820|nr:DUF2975 domain-containing protein [Emticicia sp. C21]RFS16915.1 DUF2975 domain-containing protein [Emticicia sp. C21]
MKTRTQSILQVVRIIALIGYIGAIIHGLRIIIPYIIGFFTETIATDTGTGLDHLRQPHLFIYISLMALVIAIAIIKIEIWNTLRNIIEKLNLHSPFSMEVASSIQKMSYTILTLGALFLGGDIYLGYIADTITGINLTIFKTDYQYLLSAGIVYVIAQIFKRGLELQEENELTV